MLVHYLNLQRRPDRNERFLEMNAPWADLCRVPAVDGRAIAVEDLIRNGMIQEPLRAYTGGALGCAASHRKMWEECVRLGEFSTVAEDDAVLNRHFREKAASLLTRLPTDWQIVLWGWNFDSMLHAELIEGVKAGVMWFDRVPLGERLREFRQNDYDVLPLRLLGAFGTVCYSVSPAGARHLLEGCFPLKNERVFFPAFKRSLLNFGIDTVMNKHYRSMKAYACFPPLVWTENDKTASDVHDRRSWPRRAAERVIAALGIKRSSP